MTFILVVDDDENLYRRAAEALVAAGHACGWATTPQEARDLLRLRHPALVLIDREAAQISVETLLRELEPHQRDIPIILLSALTGSGYGTGKVAHGVQDCIRKPFDPRFLVWRVEHALEVHAARARKRESQERLRLAVGESAAFHRRSALQGW